MQSILSQSLKGELKQIIYSKKQTRKNKQHFLISYRSGMAVRNLNNTKFQVQLRAALSSITAQSTALKYHFPSHLNSAVDVV